MKLTKIIRSAFAVLVVGAIVMSGIALAQTDDSPLYQHRADRLAELVEDGVITQAQADAILEGLETDAWALGTRGRGPGEGLAAAAEVLGMEVDDLRAQLLEGATLAEIAGTQAGDVVDALVADRVERLEAAVADGRLTQDEADERLADLEAHVTEFVNGEFEAKAFRHGRRGGPGAGPGAEGFGPGAEGFGPGDSGFGPGDPGFGPGEAGFGPGVPGFGPGVPGFGPGDCEPNLRGA